MKICAIIVTYNRKNLLLRNVEKLLSQAYEVDKIFIIDNHGSDGSREFIMGSVKSDKIDYSYLSENIGGAGGFWYGLKKAYEEKYAWYILMDDDGMPANDYCIRNMMRYIVDNGLDSNGLYLLNCLVKAENSEELLAFELSGKNSVQEAMELAEGDVIKEMINPFNGTFVSNGLIGAIGFPNKDFFIKGDESDYERRAKDAGAFVATVTDSEYIHPRVAVMKRKKILGHTIDVFVEAPWKEYYSTRNYIYSILHSKLSKKDKKKRVRRFLFKKYYSIANIKCNKIKTLKMVRLGAKHGKTGTMGNIVKP